MELARKQEIFGQKESLFRLDRNTRANVALAKHSVGSSEPPVNKSYKHLEVSPHLPRVL